jgi:hypothetical protein
MCAFCWLLGPLLSAGNFLTDVFGASISSICDRSALSDIGSVCLRFVGGAFECSGCSIMPLHLLTTPVLAVSAVRAASPAAEDVADMIAAEVPILPDLPRAGGGLEELSLGVFWQLLSAAASLLFSEFILSIARADISVGEKVAGRWWR